MEVVPSFKTLTKLKTLELKGVFIEEELEKELFENLVKLQKYEVALFNPDEYLEGEKKRKFKL